jgi:hypothetical protein
MGGRGQEREKESGNMVVTEKEGFRCRLGCGTRAYPPK